VVERLTSVRPATLGQALRIPGVTPAAVAIVAAHLIAPPYTPHSDTLPVCRRETSNRGLSTRCEGERLPSGWSADGLISYYELLTRWNRKINLTSIEGEDAAIDRLLLEPLGGPLPPERGGPSHRH
jgi:hypothetical protein